MRVLNPQPTGQSWLAELCYLAHRLPAGPKVWRGVQAEEGARLRTSLKPSIHWVL